MADTPQRDHVFISYSHKDRKRLEQLQTHLKPFVRGRKFSVWDDTKIKSGDEWRGEIKKAIASAAVAVLLVSPDFLASDFIAERELPPLLDAAQNEGLRILWVAVRHSSYEETEIERYQCVNDPTRPLVSIPSAGREKEIIKICKEIKAAVASTESVQAVAPIAGGKSRRKSPAAPIEELAGRIRELEGEKALLEQKHKDAVMGYERGYDGLEREYNKLKKQLADWQRYDWLASLATVHSNDISDYVVVERLYFCYHELTDALPLIVFGVDIFNKSVFNITIENSINGHIEIAGKPLLRDKRFTYNPSKISPVSEGKLTIEHRLSLEEAALIAKCDKDEFGSFFYFDRLIVMIGNGTQFPRFERTQLKLPKFLGGKDTPAATEIASLKAQLEEAVSNKKPNITGEIKEVFFKKHYSMASGAISEHHYYDYDFFISVYVANLGAVTTIKNFKFILKSNGRPKDGDKMTLEGWRIQKQTGRDGLTDIEGSNDVPLEHSRNGWLRFIVSDVQESSIRYSEDDPMPEMEIELYAIDN